MPINPIDSNGQPKANNTIWTTDTSTTDTGGTVLVEECAAEAVVVKLPST